MAQAITIPGTLYTLPPPPRRGGHSPSRGRWSILSRMAQASEFPGNLHQRLTELVANPREDIAIEVKGWLDPDRRADKCNLAKAMIALANSGGGYLLLGFEERGGEFYFAPNRPDSLDRYSQDLINGIVARYAEPAFHCETHHVAHPETGELFPVIVVPGTHRVPIRTKRGGPEDKHLQINTYYIRRPGPKSEPPASGREWDELIGRCIRAAREDLLAAIGEILTGQHEVPVGDASRLETWSREGEERFRMLLYERLSKRDRHRFDTGYWTASTMLVGNLHAQSPRSMVDLLRAVQGNESGWPPWGVPSRRDLAPYPYNGLIECWMAEPGRRAAAWSDFWRASPDGKLFLLQGYQEDGPTSGVEPGSIFDATLPLWRVGEVLLHAERLAAAMGDMHATVMVRFHWTGLKGRRLIAWASGHRLPDGLISRQEDVSAQTTTTAAYIRDQLPTLVARLSQPLYETFGFAELPPNMVRDEVTRMRQRRR